jgi:hypothetical protein
MKSVFNAIETYCSQSSVSWDMRLGANINDTASDSVWNTYGSSSNVQRYIFYLLKDWLTPLWSQLHIWNLSIIPIGPTTRSSYLQLWMEVWVRPLLCWSMASLLFPETTHTKMIIPCMASEWAVRKVTVVELSYHPPPHHPHPASENSQQLGINYLTCSLHQLC